MKPRSSYALAASALLVAAAQIATGQIPPQPAVTRDSSAPRLAPNPYEGAMVRPTLSGATPAKVVFPGPSRITVTLTGMSLGLLTGGYVERSGTKVVSIEVALLPSTDPTRRGVSLTLVRPPLPVPGVPPPAPGTPPAGPMDLVLTWRDGIARVRAPVEVTIQEPLTGKSLQPAVPSSESGYVTGKIVTVHSTPAPRAGIDYAPLPSLAGVQVTVTPRGQGSSTTTSNDLGVYVGTVVVGLGYGTVAVSNVPSRCKVPSPVTYIGLGANDTVTAPIIRVDCPW